MMFCLCETHERGAHEIAKLPSVVHSSTRVELCVCGADCSQCTPNTVLVLSRWPENRVIVGKGVVVATEAVM
jgi:hypothetical protein